MKLRGKKPSELKPRLKMLLSGPAGVGKTTAAIQMPRPYVIDCEAGCTHYGDKIEQAGGAVFATSSIKEVIEEVRALAVTRHDYLTVVIDPMTTLFNETVDEGERLVGTDFGRHYGHANKLFKRLFALLTSIDMNVVVTAHERTIYGDNMTAIGQTYDGFKKADYIFDLYLHLDRAGDERIATVQKTRLPAFPDGDTFAWGLDALAKRFGESEMMRPVPAIELATSEQVEELEALASKLTATEKRKLKLNEAVEQYGKPNDWPGERIAGAIKAINSVLDARKGS